MRFTACQFIPDLLKEYCAIFLCGFVFSFFCSKLRITILQFLGRHKCDLLRQDTFYIVIFVCHELFSHTECFVYGFYCIAQCFFVSVLFGNDLFPVPLIDINGMDIIGILIPADRIHIGVQSFSDREAILSECHTFPFGKRMYDLHFSVFLFFQIECDRAFHAV